MDWTEKIVWMLLGFFLITAILIAWGMMTGNVKWTKRKKNGGGSSEENEEVEAPEMTTPTIPTA